MKELGRFLMNDGRIHRLGIEEEKGLMVKVSIHEWPDGHECECKIYSPLGTDAEGDLIEFIAKSFENGSYVERIPDSPSLPLKGFQHDLL